MARYCFAPIRVGTCCFVAVALTLMTALAAAQATNASLQGTYTVLFTNQGVMEIQTNMFGQEVGFCDQQSLELPYGYSCNLNDHLQGGLFTGSFIADGNGNITSGSYTYAPDPNSYECSSKYNEAPDCPYQVPSGISWSSSTSYVVGDEVDYGGNTYQAVKKNTDVTPAGANVCTSKTGTKNPPGCTWDQLYQSANGSSTQSGSMSGTYSVQSNGLGTMQVTLVTSNGNMTIPFNILVPAQSAVGQEVPLSAAAQLGQGGACGGGGACGTGTAERIQ